MSVKNKFKVNHVNALKYITLIKCKCKMRGSYLGLDSEFSGVYFILFTTVNLAILY